jgi:hypothetical protein
MGYQGARNWSSTACCFGLHGALTGYLQSPDVIEVVAQIFVLRYIDLRRSTMPPGPRTGATLSEWMALGIVPDPEHVDQHTQSLRGFRQKMSPTLLRSVSTFPDLSGPVLSNLKH